VAFLQAFILGLLTMCRVLIQFPKDWASSLAISITIFTVVLAASSLGIFLNIGLSTCGIDPATAGAPIVSTSADIVGIALLCVVGYLLLDILQLGALDVYV
jgi:magnesium transporter